MRYVNTNLTEKYCSHARRLLKPAQRTAELSIFSDMLDDLLTVDKGFALELSDSELEKMGKLVDRHLEAMHFDKSEVQAYLDDPDGSKKQALKAAAEKSAKMKEYHDFVQENRAFEAMVKGETSKEKIQEVRDMGKLDIRSMNVKIGDKPKNLREAMALNAKMDIARKLKQ